VCLQVTNRLQLAATTLLVQAKSLTERDDLAGPIAALRSVHGGDDDSTAVADRGEAEFAIR